MKRAVQVLLALLAPLLWLSASAQEEQKVDLYLETGNTQGTTSVVFTSGGKTLAA